jgi:hypothetical protein
VEEAAMEEGMLELDLDEEDVVENSKFMGIVVFYSIKSYNPHNILPNMISAWGIQKLTTVEKICDYIFKLEFDREEEKVRVLEGGPWHHKGDVLSWCTMMALLGPRKYVSASSGCGFTFMISNLQ